MPNDIFVIPGLSVIPAEAGISVRNGEIPAFAGMTDGVLAEVTY